MLGLDCQQTKPLRMMKLSMSGRAATREAQRMVSEKVSAAMEAGATLATGGFSGQSDQRLPAQCARKHTATHKEPEADGLSLTHSCPPARFLSVRCLIF
jgi:hypothetical protein